MWGSMDAHVAEVQRLFSALRHEFKHLEYFYFHNCLYDFVWQDNARRHEARFDTLRLLRTYGSDYKVILVGMPPWAPTRSPGLAAASSIGMRRPVRCGWPACSSTFQSWCGSTPPRAGSGSGTPIKLMNELIGGRMHPLTLAGLAAAIDQL